MEIWHSTKPVVFHVRGHSITCMTHETMQCRNLTQNKVPGAQLSVSLRRHLSSKLGASEDLTDKGNPELSAEL